MSSDQPSSSRPPVDDTAMSRRDTSSHASPSPAAREPALRQTLSSSDSSAYTQQPLPRRSHSERVPQYRSSFGPDLNNDLPPPSRPDLSPEARRQTMMAMDRKRRLTASAHETGRRRTTTGGFTSRDNRYYQTTPRRDSQHSSGSPGGGAEQRGVIDLTTPSPPAPRSGVLQSSAPPRQHRTPSNSSRGYVVPRWQPDNEVSECPICHRQFGFLFRRHHCRKCGRVVCNDCSPHRITIPRQYIVHPPGTLEDSLSPSDIPTIDLTGGDDDEDGRYAGLPYRRSNPALGGGEKVRLCNPCVPDPQPELLAESGELPQSQSFLAMGQQRELFSGRPNEPQQPLPSTLTEFPRFQYPPNIWPTRSTESDTQLYARLQHPGTRLNLGMDEEHNEPGSTPEAYTASSRYPIMVSTPTTTFGGTAEQEQGPPQNHYAPSMPLMHSRYHSLDSRDAPLPPLPLFNTRPRISSMLDSSRNYYGMPPPAFPSGTPSRPSGPQPAASTTAPRPARRRIREEDICPVCRRELPPKGPNGEETERENHVMECISRHDTSTPTLPQSLPIPQSNTSTSLPAATQIRTQTFGASGPTISIATSNATSSSTPTAPVRRPHVPGMIRFTATEKDCTPQPNSDGELDESSVECSICMIEYEVGERLVRLECWCKFHEECIVEWVGRGGGCPLHKINS